MIKKIIKAIVLFIINNFLSGTHFFSIKRGLFNLIGFKVGINSKIVGPIKVFSNLEIGDNCWIGRNFQCEGNGEVIIKDNCDIGPNVTFLTGGHKIGDENRRAGIGEKYKIIIGKGCWICANSTLGKNIEIGDSCVVAACSCVLNSFFKNTLIGGVPGRKIKTYDKND